MLFAKQITLSSGATEATLTKTDIKVRRGMISNIWITFPSGCAGLVKLRLIIDGHPFLPVHKDAFIRGDNITFVFPVLFEILEEPSTITVEAWNEDDTFDHTIDIYILILDKSLVLPIGATEGVVESIKSLVISSGGGG